MYSYYKSIRVAVLCVVLMTQAGISQNKMTDASDMNPRNVREHSSQLIPKSGITYAVTSGSDGDLVFQPVDNTEMDLTPVHIEYSSEKKDICIYKSNPSLRKFCETGDAENSAVPTYINYSGMFKKTSSGWYSSIDNGYDSMIDKLAERKNDGYRIESFDVYPSSDNSASLYAATWVKDGLIWAWALNYEYDEFLDLLNTYKNEGRRITDVEFDKRNRNWSGVWISDSKAWRYALNYPYNDFLDLMESQKNAGNRPIDLNVYTNSNNTAFLYAGVWVGNPDNYGWAWAMNYEWSDFSQLLDNYNDDGYRLIDYEKYLTSSGMRYAGIWLDDDIVGGYSINYDSRTEFLNRIEARKNDNMRPVKFEMYTDLETAIQDDDPQKVEKFQLFQNYPNPFNPSTSIQYQLAADGHVNLKIFNILGKEVASLVNSYQKTGHHEVHFDASGLPSGMYLYRFESGNFVETRKCIYSK